MKQQLSHKTTLFFFFSEENLDLESETSSDESTWNLELPSISGLIQGSDSENTGIPGPLVDNGLLI